VVIGGRCIAPINNAGVAHHNAHGNQLVARNMARMASSSPHTPPRCGENVALAPAA